MHEGLSNLFILSVRQFSEISMLNSCCRWQWHGNLVPDKDQF